MNPVLTFEVFGPPIPKARARVVNGHAFTPAKTEAYERHVGLCALAAVSKAPQWRKDWGSYGISVRVYREADRGDADNYLKACADGVNRIVWADDKAVHEVHVWMGEDRVRPRVEVRIEMLGDEDAERRRARMRRETRQARNPLRKTG